MTGVRDLDGGERVELERAGVGTAPPDKLAGALRATRSTSTSTSTCSTRACCPRSSPRPAASRARGCATCSASSPSRRPSIGVEITAFDAPEDESERDRLAAMIESVVEPLL